MTRNICDKIGLQDVNLNKTRKDDIIDAIFLDHYKNIKEDIKGYKKMEKTAHQDFTKEQEYLHGKSVDRCRTELRIRTEMLESFKDNFRSKYRTLERGEEDDDPGLSCSFCDITPKARDSQPHCLVCPAWQDLRVDLDLTFMEDMVTYFRRVLQARADREEEEKEERRTEREEEQRRKKDAGTRTDKRRRGQ